MSGTNIVPFVDDEQQDDPLSRFGLKAPVQGAEDLNVDRQPKSFGQRISGGGQAQQQPQQKPQGDGIKPPSIDMPKEASPMPAVLDKSRETAPPAPSSTNTLGPLVQRRAAAATPIDPSDPQYKMPLWQRIVGSLTNAANGFGRTGAAPIYVGPGATNQRFARDKSIQQQNVANLDTQIGQQEKLDDSNRKLEEAMNKSAYEQRIADARNATSEAQQQRAETDEKYKADKANWEQQLADAKSAGIDVDPKTGKFMKNGSVYVPKNVEEGASLEAAFGVKNGQYSKLWGQERKNQPITVNTGQKDEAKTVTVGNEVRQFNPKTGRYDIVVGPAKQSGRGSSATFKDRAAVDKYSNSWYTKRQNDYNAQRNKINNSKIDDKEKQAQIADLDALDKQQKSEFEDRKKGYYDALSGGKPVSVDENGEMVQGDSQPQSAPAPTSGSRTPAQLDIRNLPRQAATPGAQPKPGQTTQLRDGAPPAPKEDGKVLRDKKTNQIVAVSKGGQWLTP